MSHNSISAPDFIDIFNTNIDFTIQSIRDLINSISSLSEEDLSEIESIQDLVQLEKIENFTIESDLNIHYTVSSSNIKAILPDGSQTLLQIPKSVTLYGQSIGKSQNCFIVVGGSSPAGFTSNKVFFYELNGDLLDSFEINESRKFSAVLINDGKIWIIGGMANDGNSLNLIEVYDFKKKLLRNIYMNNGRSYPCACVFNGFLYVCSKETHYVEKYSLEKMENLRSVQIMTDSGIDFIATFKEFLLVFSGKKYFVVNKNDTVVRSYDTEYEYTWTQSQIGTFENGIYFSDYFSLKLNCIEIVLPA